MMNLISVDSARKTATDGLLDLAITADIGNGTETLPYGWRNGDPNGLGPQIDAYFASHADFPVADYVAPAAVLPDLLPYQFKAILVLSGQQTALEMFFNSLPTQQKIVAQAKLDYALSFQRHDPLLLLAQQALGLSDAQLDTLWLQAAAL